MRISEIQKTLKDYILKVHGRFSYKEKFFPKQMYIHNFNQGSMRSPHKLFSFVRHLFKEKIAENINYIQELKITVLL